MPPRLGELLWAFKPGMAAEPPFWVSPLTAATASNGVIYVGASDSDVDCFGSAPSSPAAGDGAVFIAGADQVLRAIDIKTGTLRWEHAVGRQVFGSPQAADGAVYVGRLDRTLLALNTADGSLLWSYRAPGSRQ